MDGGASDRGPGLQYTDGNKRRFGSLPFLQLRQAGPGEDEEGDKVRLIISSVITGGLGLIVCLFPFPFIELFRPTEEIARTAAQAIRITIAGYPMVIFSVMYNALFVATGFSSFGLITQIFRSLLIRVPAAQFLSGILSLDQIWWFQPISSF